MNLDPMLWLVGVGGLAFGWRWAFAILVGVLLYRTAESLLIRRKLLQKRAQFRKEAKGDDPEPGGSYL